MPVTAAEISWHIAEGAREVVGDLKAAFGDEGYERQKASFKAFLSGYFSNGNCTNELGNTVSPVGATASGGKKLKVRWVTPRSGKSGGLRLAVIAYCDRMMVVIAGAWVRRDVSNDEFDAAFAAQ